MNDRTRTATIEILSAEEQNLLPGEEDVAFYQAHGYYWSSHAILMALRAR